MATSRVPIACLAAACALAVGGCTLPLSAPKPPVPGCPHIPLPPPSRIPASPATAVPQILRPGHWDWNDSVYVWTQPQWQARAAGVAQSWRDGTWQANGGACVWLNGHFEAMKPAGKPAVAPKAKN